MKKMIRVSKKYEATSGGVINLDRNVFYVHDKIATSVVFWIKALSKIRQNYFSFTYQDCPIFCGRNKICCYDATIRKIGNKVQA